MVGFDGDYGGKRKEKERKREDSIGFPSLKLAVVLKIGLRPAAAASPGNWLKMQITDSRPTVTRKCGGVAQHVSNAC